MIIKFENPEYMVLEDAIDKFRPFSFVMIKCDVVNYKPVKGYVAAVEGVADEDHYELSDYEAQLRQSDENGEVYNVPTNDPLSGESLFIEEIS